MRLPLSSYLIVILACLFSCRKNSNDGQSNALKLIWQKKFGGLLTDLGSAIAAKNDDGYIIAGLVQTTGDSILDGHGGNDIFLSRVNASGDVKWSAVYGGSSNEHPNAIAAAPDGGFVVAGMTFSQDGDVNPHTGNSAWLFKTDANGGLLWTKTIGGRSPNDNFYGITIAPDGGIVVTGEIDSDEGLTANPHGKTDLCVIKFDGSGDTQWFSSFGGSETDFGKSVVPTMDGGFIVSGFTYSSDGDASGSHGNTDMILIKVDGTGKKEWSRVIGGSGNDEGWFVIQSTDGTYLAGGVTNSEDGDINNNHGNDDAFICKLDQTGNSLWLKTYGGSALDGLYSIARSRNGNFILSGSSLSNDEGFGSTNGYSDVWLIGIEANGNRMWSKNFGGSSHDVSNAIVQNSDDSFGIVGSSVSSDGDSPGGSGNHDIWLLNVK